MSRLVTIRRPIIEVTVTDPAAGAGLWVKTVPTNGPAWKVLSVFMRYVCNATAANRVITLVIQDASDVAVLVTSDNTSHVANANDVVSYQPGIGVVGLVSAAHHLAPLPVETFAFPGWDILGLVTGNQVTDQMSGIRLLVEEVWLG